jgi:hypothetical protein
MPAVQLSFAEFALAVQAVIECTPSVTKAAPAVVAHPLAVDSGECTGPRVNGWSAAQWLRRLARQRAVSAARSVPRWGVEHAGVVRLFYSRARAFNLARTHSSYRFVGACV